MRIREYAPLCLTTDPGRGRISRGWARTDASISMREMSRGGQVQAKSSTTEDTDTNGGYGEQTNVLRVLGLAGACSVFSVVVRCLWTLDSRLSTNTYLGG